MSERVSDAAIVVAGNFSQKNKRPTGQLSGRSLARTLAAVELFQAGRTNHLIFSGGVRPSAHPAYRDVREADVMRDIAVDEGIDPRDISVERTSLTTIGNACLTKVGITEPREQRVIDVVTSIFHVRRTEAIFDRVMGPNYDINMIGVDTGTSLRERIQEPLSDLLTSHLMRGIAPGNHDLIFARSLHLHPQYAEGVPMDEIVKRNLCDLASVPLMAMVSAP